MYSDDPGKTGTEEHKLETLINEFRARYALDEFGLIQTEEDVYKVFNRDRSVEGNINLKDFYADIQQSD